MSGLRAIFPCRQCEYSKANDRLYSAGRGNDKAIACATIEARKFSGDHDMHGTLQNLFRYKAWANDELLTALARLGGEPIVAGLAIKALSHSYVVDRIFAAHMRRKAHAYASANLSELPTLEDLSADIGKSDLEYIDYVSALD